MPGDSVFVLTVAVVEQRVLRKKLLKISKCFYMCM